MGIIGGRLFVEFMYDWSNENGGWDIIAVTGFDEESIILNGLELRKGIKYGGFANSVIGGRDVTPGMGICKKESIS